MRGGISSILRTSFEADPSSRGSKSGRRRVSSCRGATPSRDKTPEYPDSSGGHHDQLTHREQPPSRRRRCRCRCRCPPLPNPDHSPRARPRPFHSLEATPRRCRSFSYHPPLPSWARRPCAHPSRRSPWCRMTGQWEVHEASAKRTPCCARLAVRSRHGQPRGRLVYLPSALSQEEEGKGIGGSALRGVGEGGGGRWIWACWGPPKAADEMGTECWVYESPQ